MPDEGRSEEAVDREQIGGGDIGDLLAALPLARAALAEITPEASIGEPLGHVVEADGVVSLQFAATLAGYPGWHWTVTVGRADEDAQPTVLEAELMPGDDALLAPDWVPWSERLAEYQAAQEALAAEAEGAGAEGDDEDGVDSDDDDDEDEDDESADSDDDDHDIHDLHGDDDLDGVDIDSIDVAYDEDTDVDSELDLASEEAAALADDEDAVDADDEDADADADEADTEAADVTDSDDEGDAEDSAVAPGAGDAEGGEAE